MSHKINVTQVAVRSTMLLVRFSFACAGPHSASTMLGWKTFGNRGMRSALVVYSPFICAWTGVQQRNGNSPFFCVCVCGAGEM